MSVMSDPVKLAVPTNGKIYPVIFLLPGPRYAELSDRSVPANLELQAQHLLFVKQNIEAGTQVMAIPIVGPDAPIAAMGVFRVDLSTEELIRLMEADPFISTGRFVYRIDSAFMPALDTITVRY